MHTATSSWQMKCEVIKQPDWLKVISEPRYIYDMIVSFSRVFHLEALDLK